MTATTFTTLRDFQAAVRAAGLTTYLPLSSHEGMHESDVFATVFARGVEVWDARGEFRDEATDLWNAAWAVARAERWV